MMLSVENLVVGYGAHDEVLKGVGITVAEHEMVVLIGPNGAGKSTLLKSIAGFLKPREGAIVFDGHSRSGGLRSARDHARQGIAFVPQEANVFPSLSIEANLEMGDLRRPRCDQGTHGVGAYARFPVLAEQSAHRMRARCRAGSARCSPSRWR